jgi:hypothetical protein
MARVPDMVLARGDAGVREVDGAETVVALGRWGGRGSRARETRGRVRRSPGEREEPGAYPLVTCYAAVASGERRGEARSMAVATRRMKDGEQVVVGWARPSSEVSGLLPVFFCLISVPFYLLNRERN